MRATAKVTLIASIAAVLSVPPAAQSAELYRSNAVGIKGQLINSEELAGQDTESPAYLLEVSAVEGREIRRLLHAGEEVQRIEVIRDGTTTTEELFKGDILENVAVRNSDAVLLREKFYSGGELTARWEYQYEGSRLTSRDVFGPMDLLLYRESYSYWGDGTLRSIVKEEQSQVWTEYRYKNGRLEEEWVSRSGESERFEFDAAGRLVIRELYSGDEMTEQEVRIYWAAGSGSLLRQVVVSAGTEIARRGYDEQGRLINERVEESGELVSELTRTFSEAFLILEVETDSEGEHRWEYFYTDEGDRDTIAYYEYGALVEISHLLLDSDAAPADRMTELFNRGEPILRIYYDGQLRLREEVIRNGEVVQTREFGTEVRPSVDREP